MSIRIRLTLWYAAIMFVSLLTMGVLSYRQFAPNSLGMRKSVGTDEEDEGDFRESLSILLWCGLPASALALAGGWWLMRKSLEPVAALTRAAEEINEHNLRRQLLRTGTNDELDRLTQVFNEMTARLDDSFKRIREFTLHASHELKTPLTVIHAELETGLEELALTPAQRERLLSELDEVQRLTKIVDGLTLLTKADAGQIKLDWEPLRLDELVREACADAQSLARPHEIEVTLAGCEETTVVGDRHRLRQLLLNLSDNAIKYNRRGGFVTLGLRRSSGKIELTVTNSGEGIPAEMLPRLFDRFFRGDPSHGNVVEGCGLGLSIAQWIVSAHNGEIEITSVPSQHTTVTVRLPLSKARTQIA
jgi:signal transduction histidine kinase